MEVPKTKKVEIKAREKKKAEDYWMAEKRRYEKTESSLITFLKNSLYFCQCGIQR